MDKFQYELNREVKILIEELLKVKELDLPEYCLLRDEIKRDFGNEFYNKYIREHLEI